MTPDDQLRALRENIRWEATGLTPRPATASTASAPHRRGAALPLVVTLLVAVLVVAASIGAIRLASTPTHRQPATTSTQGVEGATAVVRGTARTTTRVIAGVGTPGGPSASALRALRGLAQRTGKLADQPDPRRGYQVRLTAAVDGVRAAFGSAAYEYGGFGSNGFFLVLNRAPTAEELQLLRLLPMTVRLHWGHQLSIKERDRQRQAAFSVLEGAYNRSGWIDAETGTQTFEYWPDRDRPRTARQVVHEMVVAITRLTGAPPTFTISVTDLSKTSAGQAALHATGRSLSDNGIRLLIGVRPTQTGFGTGIASTTSLVANRQRCVALGDVVIIAPPGSTISADGRTIHPKGMRSYSVDLGTTPGEKIPKFWGGGEIINAKTAATYLPRGSTLCGASSFLLIG